MNKRTDNIKQMNEKYKEHYLDINKEQINSKNESKCRKSLP